jgi:hypothetical protein
MTSCCCWWWDTNTTVEKMDLVDNIAIYSEDGLSISRYKPFLHSNSCLITEHIRINSSTFFLSKKSLDGRVKIVLTFYDTPTKPQFVRGFLYIDDEEYSINTYNDDTISLHN